MKEQTHINMVRYYPQETSNLGDGHYIIFDVIENNNSSKFTNDRF